MKSDDIFGFLLGFFLGCCGLLIAALLSRSEYLRGAIAGIAARTMLGIVLSVATQPVGTIETIQLDGSTAPFGFPWELVAAFVIGTVFVAGLVAGALWAFGPRDDDDDDDQAPPPADDRSYVTFDRR